MAKEKQIGKITHFFDKINVGVVELTDGLKVGETIKIAGGDREFTQTVDSMQIEHEGVQEAKSGQAVGLKVNEAIRPGDKVYKVTE